MEEIFKKLNYQPSGLSNTELNHPEEIIETFFENYPIHRIRGTLWDLYKGWMYHATEYADLEQTRSMMIFYTQMVDFYNASFICAEKRKEKL